MDMREQKFGIEIEMTGITRQRAAEVMAAYFPLRPAMTVEAMKCTVSGMRQAVGGKSCMIPALRRRKKAAVMRGVSTR